MPIRLVTGTPGAGKTLTALQEALTQVGVDFSSDDDVLRDWGNGLVPTRPVYFCNIRGLDKRLPTIETPWEWESLPDGSLVVVDEAWEYFGKQLRNADDPRVLNLAKHRHRGFDFILTTQAPNQLTPAVRDLVGAHVHVTRKFGTQTTIRYEWPHVQSSPNGQTAKANAIEQMWRYPKKVFDLYESATLHTVKRKFPKKVLVAIGLACLAPLLLIGAFAGLWTGFNKTPESDALTGSTVTAEARSGASTDAVAGDPDVEVITPEQYKLLRTPRFADDIASAPIYDKFEVRDYPRMFCMISGDQRVEAVSCRCRTQQMTPIDVEPMTCLNVARNGYWDHRLEPQRNASSQIKPPETRPGQG